jgi:hydroxypyruvate isomerase
MIGKKSAHARAERYFTALSESLKQIAAHAEQAGVLLCLEPINHYDSDALNTWDETAAFLDECGCTETVALALDLYHMRFEERDLVATIEKTAGRIGSVQMMDDNRMAPGFGNFRFERIADAVLRSGYRGPITMECLPLPDPETAMRAAVAFYKTYFDFKTNGV